jgi:acetylornithine deacetylase/succinyl-diaminopimelate desuccinylase-like protein
MTLHPTRTHTITLAITLGCLAITAIALADADADAHKLAHDMFKQLVEIDTTDDHGNVTTAAEAMAKRLRDAGFPESDIKVLGPNDRKKNLVVRLHGTGQRKPILMIGHLDVVAARREDWSLDPFKFTEKDGYFYGRGTQDMKDGDATMLMTMIRLQREGYQADRDLILALTADEETGDSNGVDWLVKNHRDLIDAEFVLNHDGQGVITDKGKAQYFEIDATEKVYADFQLSTTNPGGHSSVPMPGNAIYELVAAVAKIGRFQFPFELNSVTRGFFERFGPTETGQRASDMRELLSAKPDPEAIKRLSTDPVVNAVIRTTCVATRLDAGHANNALPQSAKAVVNCRILPGHSAEEVRQTLVNVVGDPRVSVRYISETNEILPTAESKKGMTPPPLNAEVMRAAEKVAGEMWPGLPVVPMMSAGASDAVYATAGGYPVYQVSGGALDRNDIRAHGRDERIRAEDFYRGVDFHYRFIKELLQR